MAWVIPPPKTWSSSLGAAGDRKLLDAKSTDLIWTGRVDYTEPDSRYGYGFIVKRYNGTRIIGHGGGWVGITNKFEMYPDLGYTVVILSNIDSDPNAIASRLREVADPRPLARITHAVRLLNFLMTAGWTQPVSQNSGFCSRVESNPCHQACTKIKEVYYQRLRGSRPALGSQSALARHHEVESRDNSSDVGLLARSGASRCHHHFRAWTRISRTLDAGLTSITESSRLPAKTLEHSSRPKYLVRIEERIYNSDETDPGRSAIIPNTLVGMRTGREGKPLEAGGDSAADVAEPIVVTTLFEEDIHEARLEIIDREHRLLVTVIEIVSPSTRSPDRRAD